MNPWSVAVALVALAAPVVAVILRRRLVRDLSADDAAGEPDGSTSSKQPAVPIGAGLADDARPR